jgi:hypothetical protein
MAADELAPIIQQGAVSMSVLHPAGTASAAQAARVT